MKKSLPLFILLTAAAMLFVLSAAVAVPILLRPFYYAHVFLLDLPGKTGWTAGEICGAYDEMLDFCLFGAPFGTGVLRWSQEGMRHFADCAVLFRLDLAVLLLSFLALLLGRALKKRGILPAQPLGRGSGFWAGCLLAGAFAAVGALAALNFERAFVLFHRLFFPGKTNWLFDPAADQIILVLPQVFFRNCAILVLLLLLGGCALLILRDLRRRR